jgi:DNA-binding GntR family transcriptional regulator
MLPVTRWPDDSSDHARAYKRLKAMTVNYRFRPHEQLMIGELADQLRVSATPVREVLIRLQAQALLDTTPRRGFFAKTLDLKEMIDLVRFRFVILSSYVEQAVHRLDQGVDMVPSIGPTADSENDTASAVDAIGKRPPDSGGDNVRQVDQVSARMIALSENDAMIRVLDNVNDRTHYVRTIDFEYIERTGQVRRSIEALSFALRRKDAAAAFAILQRELDEQIDRMPALVKEGINRACTSSRQGRNPPFFDERGQGWSKSRASDHRPVHPPLDPGIAPGGHSRKMSRNG